MHYFISPVCVLLVLAACLPASEDKQPATPKVSFNRDIRPILSDHCFACHGPDKNKRQGKLRLDERDAAIAKKALVPGKPGESELIARIHSKDDSEVMPPPEHHKPLSKEQKELLERWITQGAEYQAHWAYIAPTRPALPTVKQQAWVKNPIDAFILAQLEARKIAPSPAADQATLLRRLSLDLIGLPAPAELTSVAFLKQANWYEKAVDHLLASPHYGERMAVPWLDLVRYADTVGYHGDQNQRIFPYRDYVIDAFNSNMPFDQFTREQLGGDLLPNATLSQKVATGFNRLNMMTREGGAQPEEYLAKYAADRVRTVAGTWMGSTVGCAECHDHKYDPITARDFYSLAAYFSDMKQWGVYNDYNYTPNPDLRGWSNDHPFPPEIEVESPYLKQRMAKLLKQMSSLASSEQDSDYQTWKRSIAAMPSFWSIPKVEVALSDAPPPAKKTAAPKKETAKKDEGTKKEEAPETAEVQPDGSVLFGGPVNSSPTFTLKLPAGWLSTIQIELLNPTKDGSILRSNQASSTFKPVFELKRAGTEKAAPLAIRFADANRKEPIYRNGFDVIGVKDNWRTSARQRKEPHASLWWLDQPVEAKPGDELIVRISTNLLRDVRISVSPYAPLSITELGSKPELSPLAYLRSTGNTSEAFITVKKLETEYHECRQGKAMTQVTEALAKPKVTRVLPRGNFLDSSGEVVQPRPPAFLKGKITGTSRLDLANWLTSAENPLTARVAVNRYWKMLFGNGLSNVLDDFGAQGEWPTHPELLDWLAVEFRESGWNTKHIIKLIVMSNTYRQSAVTRGDLKDIDPNNRLLAAQNPRRLEAEFIRDQALSIAGLLNRELGGPSSFPYQPAGYYAQLQFPDRNYLASRDDRQYRRGVYAHWQRTFLQPMLANFDAPSREECTANRVQANTPQQALTLLNDPSMVEAARVLAENVLKQEKDDAKRIEAAYRQVLLRAPKPAESERLLSLLAKLREHYSKNEADANTFLKIGIATPSAVPPAELAAWTNVMRVVLNLHEVLTRY
jgi:hypothetical protein